MLQKLDHYLHGAKFTIKTDHKPLKYLLTSEMKNRKVQMWVIAISGYNCQIEYIRGNSNEQADMLSRLSGDGCGEKTQSADVCMINSNRIEAKLPSVDDSDKVAEDTSRLDLHDMVKEQQQNRELRKLKKTLDNPVTGESVKRRYATVDRVLYYVNHDEEDDPCMTILVPDKYKQAVLEQYHDDCAHWGIEKNVWHDKKEESLDWLV